MNLHIYAPPYVARIRYYKCRTCRCKRRCIQLDYAWHDPLAYCLTCGESPVDWPHRFKRITRARRHKIEEARRLASKAVQAGDYGSAIIRLVASS